MQSGATAAGFVFLLFSGCLLAQSSGPESRHLTDPQSIHSLKNKKAGPVPINDLYFTHLLSGAS
jgi:hypothetical protein